MFMFDKATWQKDKADHAVQRTRWKSGAEVIANFGDAAYRLPDGRTVQSMHTLARYRTAA
jgi:hypothetical protein